MFALAGFVIGLVVSIEHEPHIAMSVTVGLLVPAVLTWISRPRHDARTRGAMRARPLQTPRS
jgi:hypothetical protein